MDKSDLLIFVNIFLGLVAFFGANGEQLDKEQISWNPIA